MSRSFCFFQPTWLLQMWKRPWSRARGGARGASGARERKGKEGKKGLKTRSEWVWGRGLGCLWFLEGLLWGWGPSGDALGDTPRDALGTGGLGPAPCWGLVPLEEGPRGEPWVGFWGAPAAGGSQGLGAAPAVAWHRGPRSATCHIACPHPASPADTSERAKPPQKSQPPPKPAPQTPRNPRPGHPGPRPRCGAHACARPCVRVLACVCVCTDTRPGGGRGCPPTRWAPLIGRGGRPKSAARAGSHLSPAAHRIKGRRRSGQRAVGSFCWGLDLELQGWIGPV